MDSGGTGSKIADGGLARCQGLVLCHCLQGGDLLLQSSSILRHGVVFGSSGACLCRGALVEGVGTVVPVPLEFTVSRPREYAVLFGEDGSHWRLRLVRQCLPFLKKLRFKTSVIINILYEEINFVDF